MVGNLQSILMEHYLKIQIIFCINEKFIILTCTICCWLLLANIPMPLMSGFVLLGHNFKQNSCFKITLGFTIRAMWCSKNVRAHNSVSDTRMKQ